MKSGGRGRERAITDSAHRADRLPAAITPARWLTAPTTFASARYNAAVKEYNVTRTSVPQVFFASLVGFRRAEFLDLEAHELAVAGTQRPLISDDGERIAELMATAGRRALSAVEAASSQARAWAEKASARGRGLPPGSGEQPPGGGAPPA